MMYKIPIKHHNICLGNEHDIPMECFDQLKEYELIFLNKLNNICKKTFDEELEI